MQTTNKPLPQCQDYLATLNRMLDLVQKTAETASAQNNHKVVIQAVREVTRIITLAHKLGAAAQREAAIQFQTPKREKSLGKLGATKKKTAGPSPEFDDRQPLWQGNWLEALASGQLDVATLNALGAGRSPQSLIGEHEKITRNTFGGL